MLFIDAHLGRAAPRERPGLLYGDTEDQRTSALDSAGPRSLPWIAVSLARLEEVLADLTG